jgi:hypothetical protein
MRNINVSMEMGSIKFISISSRLFVIEGSLHGGIGGVLYQGELYQ